MGVVHELNQDRVTAAQRSAEVDSFLWWRGESFEKQIVVKGAQIVTKQSQPDCRLPCMQGPVLETQGTLKTGYTHTQIDFQWEFVSKHNTIAEYIGLCITLQYFQF